jgi:galactitol-specific phosphotransferase system IIB component
MKFIRATPVTSSITPIKYLERRCPMSEIAAAAFFSCLSGTNARMMLVNRSSSLMKKKLMNMTENRPTPKLDRKDVAVPMNEETLETSNIFCSSARIAVSILKVGPRFGKVLRSTSLKFANGTEI